jgi:predicted SnoaL-like aldol condensation-catalyzing enzyme
MAATTQEVLTHHLDTFGKGDLAGVMADYSPESRLFTPNGMLKGPEAIRQLFTTQFKEFAKPGASFQMLRQDVDGDTAYILWKAETADNRYEIGTDTFVVKDGKIVTQTFAGKITPKHCGVRKDGGGRPRPLPSLWQPRPSGGRAESARAHKGSVNWAFIRPKHT